MYVLKVLESTRDLKIYTQCRKNLKHRIMYVNVIKVFDCLKDLLLK